MRTMAELLAKQRIIHENFEIIESNNCLLEWTGSATSPKDLERPQLQMKLRRYCWQMTEEICEALELAWCGSGRFEEISDAFHFLLDLMIITQHVPNQVLIENYFDDQQNWLTNRVIHGTNNQMWLETIVHIGRFSNTFKNRPWKRSRKDLSNAQVHGRLENVLEAFVRACVLEDITCDMLLDAYDRKHIINVERIRRGD